MTATSTAPPVPPAAPAPPAGAGPFGPPTRRRRLLRPAAAVLAGLLLLVAFPPVGLAALAVPAVGLLTLACRGTTARRGFGLGLLTGLAFFLPLLHWSGAVAGPVAWLLLAGLQALFVGALGAALAVVTRLPAGALWTAALWVGEEALRSRLPFGGFPWGRLAFSQGSGLLTPLASLGGAPLVSAAVGLLGGALAVLLTRPGRRELLLTGGLAAAVLGAALAVPVPVAGQQVVVAVVQGNVPRLGLGFNAQRSAVLDNHVDATRALAADVRAGRTPRPDLVIWPENASDIDPFTDPAAAARIQLAVRDVGVPVLVGAVLDGPGDKLSNTGVVWDPVTGPGGRYVKRHPVPFGEYIPLRGLARRVSTKVDQVPRDFVAGRRVGVLQVGPARLGDVICFEVAYDGLVRDVVAGGGRLLVVQTNNATFGRTGETSQQLAMSRLRAVEHGRAVLVAATSGISAVIGPDGRVVERSSVFTRDVLVQRVPLRSAQTPATRLGALPELLLALAGAGAVLVGRRRGSR